MQPLLCQPQAYYLFAEQLPTLSTRESLVNAAIAIAMHGLRDVEPALVRSRLYALSHSVRRRVRGRQPQAVLAHLHDVLFEEEGFRGNTQDYYNPRNSYLPAVLESRRGIPITLCLVYKVVAEGAGLEVEGLNTPGHFLARVRLPEGWMIVDPFYRGGVLTEMEAFDRIEAVTGRPVPRVAQYMSAVSHAQWLSRILVNLQHIFATSEQRSDLAAMTELQTLLDLSVY